MAQENLSPKKFGSFVLLDHLVDGGMATIYRALAISKSGSNDPVSKRIIAIKTINEVYSKDENYKVMFNDEVRIAFGLTHPNIAQIYTFGEEEGKLYTAMEYISGKNLRQYEKQNIKFPKEIVSHIIANSSIGLDYVHKFSDKFTGQHLKIIHRDISPQNIMLCYNGEVKIVDFGVAKAATNTQETQAGTLKGKVSYLAPEYLNEEATLDGRYDQFALGIVFWEMLTGEKLFTGPNEMAIIKKVFECKIPLPKTFNPSVDDELSSIVMKMLSKNRDDRYPDMAAAADAINQYLKKHFSDFNQKSVESFLLKNLKNDVVSEQETMKSFGAIDIAKYLVEENKSEAKEEAKKEELYLSPRERKLREIEQDRAKRKLKRDLEITKTESSIVAERRLFQEKLRHEMAASSGESEQTLVISKSKTTIPTIDRKPLEKTGLTKRPTTQETQTKISIKRPELGGENKTNPAVKKSNAKNKNAPIAIAAGVILFLLGMGYTYIKFFTGNAEEKVAAAAVARKKLPPPPMPASIATPGETKEEIKESANPKVEDHGRIMFEGVTDQHEVFVDDVKIEKLDTPFELPFNKTVKVKVLKNKQVVLEQEVVVTEQEKESAIILPR